MPIYCRYMILHLFTPLLVILFTLTTIIWAIRSMRFVDLIVNNGIAISDFLYLTSLLAPVFIIILLPIALFIAILHTYNKFINDRELVVLGSAGLSSLSLAVPALIVATIITAAGYILTLYVAPTAYREFKNIQFFSRNTSTLSLLQESVFNTPIKGLTVYIESHSNDGLLQGILVHDRTHKNPVTIIAQEGQLIHNKNGFLLDVINGFQQIENPSGQPDILYFDSYSMDLTTYSKDTSTRPLEPEERYLYDLLFPPTDLDFSTQLKLRIEGHHRIVWPLLSFTISLLALVCLLSGQFSRRGQWQRICVASMLAMLIIIINFAIKNLSVSHPSLLPALYINACIPVCISLYMLKKGSLFTLPSFTRFLPASEKVHPQP